MEKDERTQVWADVVPWARLGGLTEGTQRLKVPRGWLYCRMIMRRRLFRSSWYPMMVYVPDPADIGEE